MTWQEVRELYPQQWVVIEAIGASTKDGKRIIPQIALAASGETDFYVAWEKYKALHQLNPQRELYPINTTREEMDIGVIDAFGRILS